MSDKPETATAVFETVINGQTARCEIPVSIRVLYSRQARNDAEQKAREAFARLSPFFMTRQRIKVVDLIVEKESDE
jgi:hypothetical protein